MKSYKETNEEMGRLWTEADAIDEFLSTQTLSDEILSSELQRQQIVCRSKALALIWVMDEKDP